MHFLVKNGRTGAVVPVLIAILLATACGSVTAASPATAQQTAPVGHRQPNASNVPEKVLRQENALEAPDTKLDKQLNICRGC